MPRNSIQAETRMKRKSTSFKLSGEALILLNSFCLDRRVDPSRVVEELIFNQLSLDIDTPKDAKKIAIQLALEDL
ncbi:MAG: hypothetical protein Q8P18_18430 [Pseudomonadota bacterium]|nr:hypothetical protein [Pseudomonadota bacterium]